MHLSGAAAILENKKTLGTRLSLFQQWRKYRIAVLFLLVMTSSLLFHLMKTSIALYVSCRRKNRFLQDVVTGFAGSVSRNICEGILRLPSSTAGWKLRIHSFSVLIRCVYCVCYSNNIISTGQEIMISWYCVVQVGYIALGKTCWLIVIRGTQRRVPPKYIKNTFYGYPEYF